MADIDDLLAQMRAEPVPVSRQLEARVLEDSARLQPGLAARGEVGRGFWTRLVAGFGGAGMLAGMLAGMGMAALAGVYLGFVQPGSMQLISETWPAVAPLEFVELMPDVEVLLSEGQIDE